MRASMADAFSAPSYGSMRPGSFDPASPNSSAHRDAAAGPGSRGGSRTQSAAGPSPYGVLVPPRQQRQSPASKTLTYGSSGAGQRRLSSSGGMQRPSQQVHQRVQGRQAAGPRNVRFPANFPTHPSMRHTVGGGGVHGHAASVQDGYGAQLQQRQQRQQLQPTATRNGGISYGQGPHSVHRGPSDSSLAPLGNCESANGLGVCSSDGAIGSLSGNCIGSSGSGSGGMRGLGAGAMQSRDTEMQRAMQELQELQGMVASDDRDSWRFEQAARPATALRPTTAPGGGMRKEAKPVSVGGQAGGIGGAAQVMSVEGGASEAEAVRPGTSGSGVEPETEAELRLRLASAESVMRKLYRRTNDLEERLSLATAKDGSGGSPARPRTAGGSPLPGSPVGSQGGDGDGAARIEEGGDLTTAAEREQALYLLQQKEADLQRMREYTSQLASRIEHMASEQQKLTQARPSTAAAADARNDEYRERYMRMRGEYRQLLRSRTDSVRRSGRIAASGEQGVLIEQLDAALKEEAELHRKESQRLNEELYLQEKRSCDW